MSRGIIGLLATALVLSALVSALQPSQASAKGKVILEFDTMTGVARPYTGAANAIRGVSGGGLPWVIGAGKGRLRQSGELELKVQGVVFDPNDATVIERNLAGLNNQPTFRAIVSCQSIDAAGSAVVVNLTTEEFAATTGPASEGGGSGAIKTRVDLPKPCIAPIVFVTSASGNWFAATGS